MPSFETKYHFVFIFLIKKLVILQNLVTFAAQKSCKTIAKKYNLN